MEKIRAVIAMIATYFVNLFAAICGRTPYSTIELGGAAEALDTIEDITGAIDKLAQDQVDYIAQIDRSISDLYAERAIANNELDILSALTLDLDDVITSNTVSETAGEDSEVSDEVTVEDGGR